MLVVDDHRTLTDLLKLALDNEPGMACAGTAHTVEDGLRLAAELRPDVVLMDVRVGEGDGVTATAELIAARPDLRVVVMTAHAEAGLLERAAAAGACCLLPKDGSLEEMLTALRRSSRDGFVVHPTLLKTLISAPRREKHTGPALTSREIEVLHLLDDGLDARRIAQRLSISLNTTRGHVRSLLGKLDAHSQVEALAHAKRRGLIDDRRVR